MSTSRNLGRLALRHEGLEWVAYYAAADSMDAAQRLGAINYNLIVTSVALRQQFVALMKEVINEITREEFGQKLDWNPPVPAPAHEQSGHR